MALRALDWSRLVLAVAYLRRATSELGRCLGRIDEAA